MPGGSVGLHLFHLLGVVPFFFYIGLTRSAIPDGVFYFLIALGAFLILYHGVKSIYKIYIGSSYFWVNMVHALIVGPLLLYIGIMKKTTPRAAYEGLLLITFGALGYHLKMLAEDVSAPTTR